jgi:hypothetical protein
MLSSFFVLPHGLAWSREREQVQQFLAVFSGREQTP